MGRPRCVASFVAVCPDTRDQFKMCTFAEGCNASKLQPSGGHSCEGATIFTPAEKIAALREAMIAEGGIDAVIAWFRELRDDGRIVIRKGESKYAPMFEISKGEKA